MALEYGGRRTQESFEARLAALAASQYGVFTRRQALASGASEALIDRRLAIGSWDRMYPGVYRLGGAPRTWLQSLMGAMQVKGPDATVAGLSAAALARLPGFEPGPLELIVPRTRRKNMISGLVVRRQDLQIVDITRIRQFRVTTIARTLIDIASLVPRDWVEEALDDALRRRLVTLPRLRWRVSELSGSGRRGSAIIRDLLEARDQRTPVPQSVLETRVLRKLIAAGLPEPVLQYEIHSANGLVARVDFALPDLRIAIEADGYRWHGSRLRFEEDLGRRNAITGLGWELFHLTWSDLSDSKETAIKTILRVVEERRGVLERFPASPR